MKYLQILDCTSSLGNCCMDYGLVSIIDITRKIFELIQLFVPIILVVMLTFQFGKLVLNPEEKNGMKNVINKLIAAVVCFFLPVILDAAMGMLPDSFVVTSCWENAKVMREVSLNTPLKYIKITDRDPYNILPDPDGYEQGEEHKAGSGSSGPAGVGAQRLLSVAIPEIGNNEGDNSHAKYETFNHLDLSQPWCAAFVTWCAGQAGFLDSGILPRYVGCSAGASWFKSRGQYYSEGSGYTPQPGDIVFYGSGGGYSHTGIVERADADYVYTIEGNTSCEGEAVSKCHGAHGVSRKTRNRHTGYVYGYGKPNY